MIVMMAVMFGIMYFLVIRPQQKKQKEHQAFLAAIKVGDQVVTSGGLLGVVAHVEKDVVTLEVGDKLRLQVLRSFITSTVAAQEAAASGQPAQK